MVELHAEIARVREARASAKAGWDQVAERPVDQDQKAAKRRLQRIDGQLRSLYRKADLIIAVADYIALRADFRRFRVKFFVGSVVVALGLVLFAWAANPPSAEQTPSLHSADLTNARLRGANLRNADLSGANLTSADLSGASMYLGVLLGYGWFGYLPLVLRCGGAVNVAALLIVLGSVRPIGGVPAVGGAGRPGGFDGGGQ